MDALNKGLNNSVLQELRECQVGLLKKGQRGVLPSPYLLQRMGLELEKVCGAIFQKRPRTVPDGLSKQAIGPPHVLIAPQCLHFLLCSLPKRGRKRLVHRLRGPNPAFRLGDLTAEHVRALYAHRGVSSIRTIASQWKWKTGFDSMIRRFIR
jgi:hypothetical protein